MNMCIEVHSLCRMETVHRLLIIVAILALLLLSSSVMQAYAIAVQNKGSNIRIIIMVILTTYTSLLICYPIADAILGNKYVYIASIRRGLIVLLIYSVLKILSEYYVFSMIIRLKRQVSILYIVKLQIVPLVHLIIWYLLFYIYHEICRRCIV
jgi:hypothetical protein